MKRAASILGVLYAACMACAGPLARGQTTPGDCPATPLAQTAPPDHNTARLTNTWYSDGALWAGPVPPYRGQWYAGAEGMKVGWWRATRGRLSLEGKRLDAPAPPMEAAIPDYGDMGFQSSLVFFPTEGCWEIVAHVGTSHTFRIVALVQPAGAHPLATPSSARHAISQERGI